MWVGGVQINGLLKRRTKWNLVRPRSAVSPCEVNEQFLKEQLLEGGEEGVTM